MVSESPSHRVLLLGGGGLAGSAIATSLSEHPDIHVTATYRTIPRSTGKATEAVHFVFGVDDLTNLIDAYSPTVVINAIGITRQKILIRAVPPAEVWSTNAMLPRQIAGLSVERSMRFLHISTDCVFDGSRGYYLEGDPPSPADLYGRTKLAGEALDARSTVIRTSFIGPHEDATGLMEWVSSQPRGSSVDGYADHLWNGVTTTALGALVRSWVLGLAHFEPLQHIYSWPPVSKSDLLIQLRRCLSRDDLRIHPRPTGHPRNQALLSAFPSSLEEAWSSIGYSRIPHITALLDRL